MNSFILLVRHLQRGVIAELLSLGTALEFFAHKVGQQKGSEADRVNSGEMRIGVFCELLILHADFLHRGESLQTPLVLRV